MTDTVLSATHNKVRTLTLNRPQRLNALNAELLSDLRQELDAANTDPQIGTIVLRGAGRAFCAGDDLKDFQNQSKSRAEAEKFIEAIQDVYSPYSSG